MRRRKKILIASGVVLIALFAVIHVFRDQLATRGLALVVDNLTSVHCTHAHVHITPSLRRIFVSPLECQIEAKPMRHLTTHDDAMITMGAIGIDDVHVKRVTVDYKERDLSKVHSNTLGDIAELIGVSDKLVKSLLDASENYSSSAPPVHVDVLTMQRAGETAAVMHDFSKSADGVWERTFAERVESGPIEIRAFDMHATPSRGRFRGNIYLGSKDTRGEKPDVQLELDGEQLDSAEPRVTVHVR